MREVTVALAQTSPALHDVERNLKTMCEVIERVAIQRKVDLIVFPELCTSGYECGVRFAELAERVNDRTVET